MNFDDITGAARDSGQEAGLITCARGRVTLLDRDGLIAATCECNTVVYDESIRLGLLD